MNRARQWALAGLLLAGACVAALVRLNHLDETPPTATAMAATTTTTTTATLAKPEQIARGSYLARAGNCMGCHTAVGGRPYAGGRAIATPFGSVFSPNLTPDIQHGLGAWSADDFWTALHNGRGRDGRLLNPAFPYSNYSLVSRADSDALWAYLRSLTAVSQANRAQEMHFPFGTQPALAVWRALYFRPGVYQNDAQRSAEWNRGAYLAQGLGHCNACHAPRNSLGATPGPQDFSGGFMPELGWYAPSLQDPSEASVRDWPQPALRHWLKTGTGPQGSALGPMSEVILGSTQHLSDADLVALATYLQSLPQIKSPPPQTPGRRAEPALRSLGRPLYAEHCAHCHGVNGEGVPGAYPALAGSRTVTMASPANLLRIIQRGGFAPATTGNPRPFGMPPFSGVLSDDQQAALTSYLRSAWGNQAQGDSDVRPMDVLQLKRQQVN
ncbi:cytochrome c [Roseateles koreensis]|uniref:Cytochrome c n=1 Tax=Roseateles koreensis TaxID=2987526 RepID=A0ABT5KR85_9BURK|nr:cytochrome c [Roseateles koreensis]MDC8785429.1 cytochrome c [Roseateles koreensis]